MKIRYQEVERISRDMLLSVSRMESHLVTLKKKTEIFAPKLQDEISGSALSLIAELSVQIKGLRNTIENKAEIVEDASKRLERLENMMSKEIGKI